MLICLYKDNQQNIERDVTMKTEKGYPLAQFDIVINGNKETIYCECKATTSPISLGNKTKPYRNTIYYTIDKIEKHSNGKNKKMLFFTTSFYKIGDNEKSAINKQLCPESLQGIEHCFITKEVIAAICKNNEWADILLKHF